jgi:hypothetical protein
MCCIEINITLVYVCRTHDILKSFLKVAPDVNFIELRYCGYGVNFFSPTIVTMSL